ncbi:MAG TPA: hypothetical protein VHC22_28250 [Pirellulales bacterium]|nr:hypothetical protein [Pirellulales bacterium]
MAAENPQRVQFSLRLLLVATAVVAGATATVAAKPSLVSVISTLACAVLLFSVSTLAFMKTGGTPKAFWLGMAIPTGIAAVALVVSTRDFVWVASYSSALSAISDELARSRDADRLVAATAWCIAPINGALCAFIHWLIWPNRT